MGRHDVTEVRPGLNKDLEQHYKDVIALKDAQLAEAKELLNEFDIKIEQFEFTIRMKDAEIGELRNALIDRTIAAAEYKKGGAQA